MQAFSAKGRFADMLRAIPVHVVIVNAALLGAAIYGLEQAAQQLTELRRRAGVARPPFKLSDADASGAGSIPARPQSPSEQRNQPWLQTRPRD